MARTRTLLLPLVLALVAVPLARTSAGPDEDAELKKARKELKKNAGKLQKMCKALDDLVVETRRISVTREADKKKKQEEQCEELRRSALEVAIQVGAADNQDAAEFLLPWTMTVVDQALYEKGRDLLGRFTEAGAQKVLLEALVGDLVEEGKKKKKSKDEQGQLHLRCLVAEVCEVLSGEAVAGALATVIEKESNLVLVNAAVKAAANKEDKRVVTALIGLLGRIEKAGGWEYFSVRGALLKLTGEDFLTHERWSEWWKQNEAGFDFAKKGQKTELGTRERKAEEKPPLFFGSEIQSNRLCFVIDCSGSMQMTDRPPEHALQPADFEKADPDSAEIKALQRIERAKHNLVEAIKNLLPTQKFNVINYSSGVANWQPAVVDATEANKAAAIKYVEGLRADGGTYTDDALKRAFSDPLVDTIYLLSDGAPLKKIGSSEKVENWPKTPEGKPDLNQPVAGPQQIEYAEEAIGEIMETVRLENRFRKVKIFTFGMDGPGVWHKKWQQPRPSTLPVDTKWLGCLSNFMRNLAALTGGEYKSI